jgi:hypothetical protein
MAGTSRLVCNGFIEADTFERSKDDLIRFVGLTERQVDDRLETLMWALQRDANAAAERIPSRNLWVAVTAVEAPLLRVYLRPRGDVADECELLWIEERFEVPA